MPSIRALLISGFILGLAGALSVTAAQPPAPESPAFHEFMQRVQQYLKLHKATPRLRTTPKPEEIQERRRALAQTIRAARADAKPGDIFTPEASEEFRRAIRGTLQGPAAPIVRKTIRQGEPVQGWHLMVNGDYPDHLPLTTVPPTLLLRLPRLPADVAYRIVGRDFVLEDTQARMIVDFIAGALP